jgi:hypothetical protein
MHMTNFFLTFFEHRSRRIVEYSFSMLSFNNVVVIACMFFHFEPDNDFAIRCIQIVIC